MQLTLFALFTLFINYINKQAITTCLCTPPAHRFQHLGWYPYIISDDGSTDGTLEIIRYKGIDSDIVIPSQIDGIAVTSIGSNVFVNTNVKTITMLIHS